MLSSTLGDTQARKLLGPSLQGSSSASTSALDALSTLQQMATGQPEDLAAAPPSPGEPMLMLNVGDAAWACSDGIQISRAALSLEHFTCGRQVQQSGAVLACPFWRLLL